MTVSYKEVAAAMREFIVRACKENATPEEIAALPEVALALRALHETGMR